MATSGKFITIAILSDLYKKIRVVFGKKALIVLTIIIGIFYRYTRKSQHNDITISKSSSYQIIGHSAFSIDYFDKEWTQLMPPNASNHQPSLQMIPQQQQQRYMQQLQHIPQSQYNHNQKSQQQISGSKQQEQSTDTMQANMVAQLKGFWADPALDKMPHLFRHIKTNYTSNITQLKTYIVERKFDQSNKQYLMKAIINEKCMASTLKLLLTQLHSARYQHYNLPKIVHLQKEANYSYIIYEKPSLSLLPINHLFHLTKGNVSLCKSIIYELCRTLQYTHSRRIVHRDLRPNNIFISIDRKRNKLDKLLLIDFGISKALKQDKASIVCKEYLHYPAPEMLIGLYVAPDRMNNIVDSWFVGILLLMMLNGNGKPLSILELMMNNKEIKEKISGFDSLYIKQIINEKEKEYGKTISNMIYGLLRYSSSDNKNKYGRLKIDDILWSDWVSRKLDYKYIYKCIVEYWLRIYGVNNKKCFKLLFRFLTGIKQESLVYIHQTKTDYNNYSYIDKYIDIYCHYHDIPIIIEYTINYAKSDVWFGIISGNGYNNNNNNALSLSCKTGKCRRNSNIGGNEYWNIIKGGELKDIKVCLRIDVKSRILSFKIDDKTLEPLYYDFKGVITPILTLLNYGDKVTINCVKYELEIL